VSEELIITFYLSKKSINSYSGQGIIEKNYHDKKVVQDVVVNFELTGE
jgi:hypothetical protein